MNWKLLAFFPLAGALLQSSVSSWANDVTIGPWALAATLALALALANAVRSRPFLHGLLAGVSFWTAFLIAMLIWLWPSLRDPGPPPPWAKQTSVSSVVVFLLAQALGHGLLLGGLTALAGKLTWKRRKTSPA